MGLCVAAWIRTMNVVYVTTLLVYYQGMGMRLCVAGLECVLGTRLCVARLECILLLHYYDQAWTLDIHNQVLI